MISYETYCRIKQYAERDGLNISQIAATMRFSRQTVARWYHAKNFTPRKTAVRTSKLDPYKDSLVRLLEKHDYTGRQLLQRLREDGYQGGYSILKDYLRDVRPARRAAYLTLSFAPGECAQVDWGEYGTVSVGSTRRRLSFFVMVLCYSRMMYLEFTVLQTMEHFLGCHLNAFEFFGGVPQRTMIDNLKSGVLRHFVGEAPVLNPRYLDFANHYGFSITACAPRKGNEKGRVENGVGYVKKNLLGGLDIPDLAGVKLAGRTWLGQVANIRLHAETKKRPCDLFLIEKPTLKPLPPHPYDVATIASVRASSRFRVTLDTNRYSVPAQYAGARLTLKSYPDRVCIYSDADLIARHPRSYDRHQDFEHPDHPKVLLEQRRKAKQQTLYKAFLQLSSRAEQYYQHLCQKRLNPLHHIAKIVALAETYGHEAVSAALDSAFSLQAFSSEYIANILEARTRLRPDSAPLHLTHGAALLELEIDLPDMSIYERSKHDDHNDDND